MSIFPEFKICKIEEDDTSLSAIGSINRVDHGKEKWIDEGWVGTLMKDSKVAFGRWSKDCELWKFKFDDEETDKIVVSPGDVLFALDGYWGERVEITLDETIEWEECEFLSEGQWDHDHCAICWASISECENTIYFKGDSRHPVCPECYKNHVKKRDIGFVPNA